MFHLCTVPLHTDLYASSKTEMKENAKRLGDEKNSPTMGMTLYVPIPNIIIIFNKFFKG